ncbi:MAG: serine/threonine protein kinase [bacterium]|nr:serine/threonine protein kinase [bacterium]
MDKVVAARMEKELTGKAVGGWLLDRYLGAGKSALVFHATKDGHEGAVKVFDREMVERFGKPAQRERVLRERDLVGKHHPNLIRILDAGEDEDLDVFFVVMEFFPGKNLAEVLQDVPIDRVHSLVAQVASAAEFLESLGLAHRDIKPENIGISGDCSKAVLFDLGVIRPIGLGNVTDAEDQKRFVGTLQYSPPELLIREEQNSTDGWRSVTFYQLGAVLHDLLTRQVIFADYLFPYPRLVEAVRHTIPTIIAPDAPPDLVLLAQNCLVKSAATRLELVSWESFKRIPAASEDVAAARERITQRLRAAAGGNDRLTVQPSTRTRLAELRQLLEREVQDIRASSGILPALSVEPHETTDHLCLRLLFARSQAHALAYPVVMYLDVAVIDAAAGAVRIRGGALLDSSPSPCARDREAAMEAIVFEGVCRPELVRGRIQDFMMLGIDRAQHAFSQGYTPTAGTLSLSVKLQEGT